jgi:hypothetical protein
MGTRLEDARARINEAERRFADPEFTVGGLGIESELPRSDESPPWPSSDESA